MLPLCPADELAALRLELRRLTLREAVLCAEIQRLPEGALRGQTHRAEVRETALRAFDPQLLPLSVRADPRYWRDEVTQQVCLVEIARGRPARRPGWPIIRPERHPEAVH